MPPVSLIEKGEIRLTETGLNQGKYSLGGDAMKRSLLALMLFALLAAPASPTTRVAFDREWWNTSDQLQQLVFTQGATEGIALEAALLNKKILYSRNYGTYQLDINSFYSEYPQSTARVTEILTCLSDAARMSQRCKDGLARMRLP